jgi:hypothetical protein
VYDLIKLKGTKEDYDKYKVPARTPARTCSLALARGEVMTPSRRLGVFVDDGDCTQEDVKKVVSRLPLPNRTLLQYLIHFLLRISFCSEVLHPCCSTWTPRRVSSVFYDITASCCARNATNRKRRSVVS